jgi:hypothetical protein
MPCSARVAYRRASGQSHQAQHLEPRGGIPNRPNAAAPLIKGEISRKRSKLGSDGFRDAVFGVISEVFEKKLKGLMPENNLPDVGALIALCEPLKPSI